MFNVITNIYVVIIFSVVLAFEMLISRLIEVSAALPWSFTISIYFLFVLYQIIIRVNEETEKNKIRALLFELMDSIEGIPIMNKNERLIIKWDLVFKKLVDFKEFTIYDKLIKAKTQNIDSYVNKYPSLLRDDLIEMKETKHNSNLNSTIRSKRKKDEKVEVELVIDEDLKRKLMIRNIKADTAAISNYDSSIYIDVMLKNEFVPEEAAEMGIEPQGDYDGFSVWMAYKNSKYNVVPRIMVHKKIINKFKWFIDNMDALLQCAEAIVNGDANQIIHVDSYKLTDYLQEMPIKQEPGSFITFKQVKNEELVFTGIDQNNKEITAYCEFKAGYNRFEVTLKNINIKVDDRIQNIEMDKTVAIGSGFQPIITLLEKMPELIHNIEHVINNQDINSIVIS